MDPIQKKNNVTIIIIFAMSIIPFCIAWYHASNADWSEGGTNHGKLITPVVTTEKGEFTGYDEFSVNNMKELAGHWVLVNIIPNEDCNVLCQQAIHKTKQLRLMMNKDLTRIRRVVLISSDVDQQKAKQWWKEDIRLLRSKLTSSMDQKIKTITNNKIADGMLILMDPLGNLMMMYESDFDVYKVKRDLGKLLRISQIG